MRNNFSQTPIFLVIHSSATLTYYSKNITHPSQKGVAQRADSVTHPNSQAFTAA